MRKRLLLVGTVLLLAIPLVLLLKDFTREVLLVEVLRLIWAVRILLESIPQLPLWGLFIVIVLIIAVSSLLGHARPARTTFDREAEYEGQVRLLVRWIQRAEEGEYFKWSLARHLGQLTLEVLAYCERTTVEDVTQLVRKGGLCAPAEVQEVLQAGLMPVYSVPLGFFSRFRRRLPSGSKPSVPDPALLEVVQFVETQLELEPELGARPQPEAGL